MIKPREGRLSYVYMQEHVYCTCTYRWLEFAGALLLVYIHDCSNLPSPAAVQTSRSCAAWLQCALNLAAKTRVKSRLGGAVPVGCRYKHTLATGPHCDGRTFKEEALLWSMQGGI